MGSVSIPPVLLLSYLLTSFSQAGELVDANSG